MFILYNQCIYYKKNNISFQSSHFLKTIKLYQIIRQINNTLHDSKCCPILCVIYTKRITKRQITCHHIITCPNLKLLKLEIHNIKIKAYKIYNLNKLLL